VEMIDQGSQVNDTKQVQQDHQNNDNWHHHQRKLRPWI
jgi:hypothetical protein